MLKLELQYFGHLMWRNWLIGKDPDAGKDWRQEEEVTSEDEMVGSHHWLDGHEFEQAPGIGDGQGGLACCSPWGHKKLDTSERMNWYLYVGFLSGSDGEESACSVGDLGSIAGLGRFPGEGNGYPLQYSCQKNSMDRGVSQATVHGVTESWTQLSDFETESPYLALLTL